MVETKSCVLLVLVEERVYFLQYRIRTGNSLNRNAQLVVIGGRASHHARFTHKSVSMTATLYEDVDAFARRKNRHRLVEERRNSKAFKRGGRGQPRRHDFILFFSSVVASAIALFAAPCEADCTYANTGAYYSYICFSPFNNGEIQTALQYCNPSNSNTETFENCHDYYGVHISDWDVSRVGDMQSLSAATVASTQTSLAGTCLR